MPELRSRQKTQNQNDDPALDAHALLAWYDRHARNLPWRVAPHERAKGVQPDPYRVWLSEIMLQQTTVAAVRDYYLKFTTRWPDVAALAAAPLDDVLAAWAGLGYYARARNLHACAQKVAERDGRFPTSADELQALPGIGPYTAAAIAAICYDEPIAVVDGNVERVMARFLALDKPVREVKDDIRSAVQAVVPGRSGDFAQAMMDLGASLCAPRAASCMLCPLQPDCRAAATGQPTDYPVKAVKADRPVRYGHAFVARRADGAVWLTKRPEKGLLAKMAGVPGSDWQDDKTAPAHPISADWKYRGTVVHVFTHFRLELDVWVADTDVQQPFEAGWWSAPKQWPGEALPSLFKKVLATTQK